MGKESHVFYLRSKLEIEKVPLKRIMLQDYETNTLIICQHKS